MSERFTKLYELQKNLYSEGSPVIVSAGSLLKDTQTNNIIVQLKFHSVSVMAIKALKVGITAFDIAGKEIDGISEYQYLDLCVQNGQEFGSNKAIVMPNPVTRSFTIKSITIVLTDDHVQNVSMPLSSLPQSVVIQSLLKDVELVKQYKLKTNDSATYVPQEADRLWQCHCGEWNSCSVCSRCKGKKSITFAALALPALTNEMNARLADEEQEKAEAERLAEIERQEKEKQLAKKREIEKKKRQRNTKIAKIAAIILTPTIIFILLWHYWLLPNVIEPSRAYSEAEQLLADGYYSDAATAFEALGDYKDSPARLEEVVTYMMDDIYEYGMQLMQEGNYESAIERFEAIINYKDASAKVDEANAAILEREYIKAQNLLSEGKYEDAIGILSEISSYKDAQDLIYSAHYHIGMHLLENNQYTNAYKEFELSNNYENCIGTARQWLLEKMQYANCVSESIQGTDSHLVALCSNGTVVSVDGRLVHNEYGENNVAQWSDVVSICADSFLTFGVRSNGTVLATGRDVYGECKVSGWNNISKVFSGFSHTVGLRTDGTVVAVGNNESGQCNVDSWTNIVDIETTSSITIGLRSDGKLCIAGQDPDNDWVYGALEWTNIVDVSADIYQGCMLGLTADGKVLVVSKNHFDLPPELGSETVIDICVDDAAFFLTESGKVYYTKIADSWYYDDGIEAEQNIIAISADRNHFVGLRADGTVFVTGYHDYSDYDVADWKDLIAVKALNRVLVGITANGTVLVVGDDSDELDISAWTNIYIPK